LFEPKGIIVSFADTMISVIIPTYKPGKYLNECLSSLAKQSISKDDFMVTVVLNGCCEPWLSEIRDDTRFLHAQYGLQSEILQCDLGNVSNARNIGLRRAKGEYICFIDDDDYVSSTYLEQLLSKASKDTVSLCRPYAFNDGDSQELPYRITNDWNRCHLNGKQPFYLPKRFFDGPCMKMIHRDIIGDRRFDTGIKNGEDSIFMFLISDKIKYADFTDSSAVYYRRIRQGSAQSNLNTLGKRWKAVSGKVRMYFKYFFKSPSAYCFRFFASRVLASVNTLRNG